MHTYVVKIYRDGIHVDTQTVKARNHQHAPIVAMAYTRVLMRGALVSFDVVEVAV